MLGFEPRISGVGSDRSTNWATTTARLAANLTPSLGRKLFDLSGPQMHLEPWKLSISLEIGFVMVGGYRPHKRFLTEKISMQMVLLEFKAKNLDSFD